jgi:hypothetical protein
MLKAYKTVSNDTFTEFDFQSVGVLQNGTERIVQKRVGFQEGLFEVPEVGSIAIKEVKMYGSDR